MVGPGPCSSASMESDHPTHNYLALAEAAAHKAERGGAPEREAIYATLAQAYVTMALAAAYLRPTPGPTHLKG